MESMIPDTEGRSNNYLTFGQFWISRNRDWCIKNCDWPRNKLLIKIVYFLLIAFFWVRPDLPFMPVFYIALIEFEAEFLKLMQIFNGLNSIHPCFSCWLDFFEAAASKLSTRVDVPTLAYRLRTSPSEDERQIAQDGLRVKVDGAE